MPLGWILRGWKPLGRNPHIVVQQHVNRTNKTFMSAESNDQADVWEQRIRRLVHHHVTNVLRSDATVVHGGTKGTQVLLAWDQHTAYEILVGETLQTVYESRRVGQVRGAVDTLGELSGIRHWVVDHRPRTQRASTLQDGAVEIAWSKIRKRSRSLTFSYFH